MIFFYILLIIYLYSSFKSFISYLQPLSVSVYKKKNALVQFKSDSKQFSKTQLNIMIILLEWLYGVYYIIFFFAANMYISNVRFSIISGFIIALILMDIILFTRDYYSIGINEMIKNITIKSVIIDIFKIIIICLYGIYILMYLLGVVV